MKANKIGGWLLLLCVILTIIIPLYNGINIVTLVKSIDTIDEHYRWAFLFSIPFYVVMACWSIYAGYSLWSGRANCVNAAKAYFIVAVICQFMISIIITSAFNSARYDVIINQYAVNSITFDIWASLGKSFIVSLVWYSYLTRSKRVRTTYTINQ